MWRCVADPANPLQRWRWRNVSQSSHGKTQNGSVLYTIDARTGRSWCLGDSGPFSPGAAPRGPELCNVTGGRLLEGTLRNWNFSLRADGHWNVSCVTQRVSGLELQRLNLLESSMLQLQSLKKWCGLGGRDGPATRDTAQLAYSMQPFASGPVPHSRWLMGDKYQNDYDKQG